MNSALIYTNLITFEDDEFHTATAKKRTDESGIRVRYGIWGGIKIYRKLAKAKIFRKPSKRNLYSIRNLRKVIELCELSVFIKGENVFKDVIYAKADGNRVILRDVLGASKVLEDCKILEIDITSERLILSPSS